VTSQFQVIIIIIIKNNARYSQPSGEVMDDGGIFESLLYAFVGCSKV